MYDLESLPVRVVFTGFQVLGLICTAWRIYFRLRINRFWWEDAWAAATLFSCLASLIGQWTYVIAYSLTSNVGFWFYSLGSTSVVRATHLSILYSVIRIVRGTRLARFSYFCAACCGIFWTAVVSGRIWQCASDPSWHRRNPPACIVKPQILIFEFASDCLVVAILVVLPLRVLWRVKLPTRPRRMILCVFASSVVLAFAAVFHVVGHVLNVQILMVAGVNFETTASIIMCNLLVVVTCMYRFLSHDDRGSRITTTSDTDTDSDDFTQSTGQLSRSPPGLTTVEIGSSILRTQQYTTHITIQNRSVSTGSVHA